ncbi:hypothetical protein L842_2749 [Mycobacterium intracellulare MIN_052511_1280]|nr:hypothetical protein L842_2749 [Mycobacterium intracellulare MIN_052511_1280]
MFYHECGTADRDWIDGVLIFRFSVHSAVGHIVTDTGPANSRRR